MGRGALPACRPPYPQPAATRSGRAAALYGSAGPSFWRCAFRRSRRRAYVLYSPNSPLLVHRDLCAQRSTTLRGLEMTAKFVARARTALRRHRAHHHAQLLSCHDAPSCMPQTRGLQDRRSVSDNFEERGARASLLHARSRWPCPLFISDRLCACDSVCRERVRVRVMGRASPAMYPLAYCFAGVSPPRNPFSKNKNWTF